MAYFSNRAAQRIVSGIRRIEQIPVEPRSHRPHGPRLGRGGKHEGYLCEDLGAATDTLTGPTTAEATKLVKNEFGDLTHGSHVTITNRDTTLTLEAWTYIIWERINGENRIVWAACAGEVSSSCETSSSEGG